MYIGEKSAVSVGDSKEVSILKTRPTLETTPSAMAQLTHELNTGKTCRVESKNACASPCREAGPKRRRRPRSHAALEGDAAFGPKVSMSWLLSFGSFVGRRPRCRITPRDVRAAVTEETDTSPSPHSVPVIWLPAAAVEIEPEVPEFEGRVSNGAETPASQSDLDEYASAHGSAEEWEPNYGDPVSSAYHFSSPLVLGGDIPKSERMQIHHEADVATFEQLVSKHAALPASAPAPTCIPATLLAPIPAPAPAPAATLPAAASRATGVDLSNRSPQPGSLLHKTDFIRSKLGLSGAMPAVAADAATHLGVDVAGKNTSTLINECYREVQAREIMSQLISGLRQLPSQRQCSANSVAWRG